MDYSSLSSEDRLLLYCARTAMNEDTASRLKDILNQGLDWEYIVESSTVHCISPLLYWNLRSVEGKDVPENVIKQLGKKYLETVGKNMVFYYELGRVLRVLKDAGIHVICLKGIFLAEIIYKNIGLRPFNDIDLLIRNEDLQKVQEKLSQLMYRPSDVFPTEWHMPKWINLCEDQQIGLENPKKKIMLEVHWHIHPRSSLFRVDINIFWENAQPTTIAQYETLVFAPEDLLQHLCLHLHKHTLDSLQLRWCCDIAEVIKHYKKINWKYLIRSSRTYRTEKPVVRGLYFVKNYLKVPVPAQVLHALDPTMSSNPFDYISKMPVRNAKKISQDLVHIDER
ncbi:MAG: nucleotidyltransferase family protein [Theionarchaea archaeon]|nr:nucleotidyltransferase family protein [Theionarchaea archaeon]